MGTLKEAKTGRFNAVFLMLKRVESRSIRKNEESVQEELWLLFFCFGDENIFDDFVDIGDLLLHRIGKAMQFVKWVVFVFHDRFWKCSYRSAYTDDGGGTKGGGNGLDRLFDEGDRLFDGAFFVEKELFEPDGTKIKRDGVHNLFTLNERKLCGATTNVDGYAVADGQKIGRGDTAQERFCFAVDNFYIESKLFFYDAFE